MCVCVYALTTQTHTRGSSKKYVHEIFYLFIKQKCPEVPKYLFIKNCFYFYFASLSSVNISKTWMR